MTLSGIPTKRDADDAVAAVTIGHCFGTVPEPSYGPRPCQAKPTRWRDGRGYCHQHDPKAVEARRVAAEAPMHFRGIPLQMDPSFAGPPPAQQPVGGGGVEVWDWVEDELIRGCEPHSPDSDEMQAVYQLRSATPPSAQATKHGDHANDGLRYVLCQVGFGDHYRDWLLIPHVDGQYVTAAKLQPFSMGVLRHALDK